MLSLERLTGIEELDRTAHTMTVRAGTPLQAVQQAAADAGYLFPLDLGARGSCTIGGNIATNAGGNQVIRFGMMRSLVLGLEAVLADGTVVSSMNKMLKNNAGYDLKQLFIGTEGTLGVVTRAVLRLYPQLPSKVTALCALRGFDATVELLRSLQTGLGGALSAFEAMWASYFHYVLAHAPGVQSPFDREYPLYALIEIEGTHEAAERPAWKPLLEAAFDAEVIADAAIAQSLREAQELLEDPRLDRRGHAHATADARIRRQLGRSTRWPVFSRGSTPSSRAGRARSRTSCSATSATTTCISP